MKLIKLKNQKKTQTEKNYFMMQINLYIYDFRIFNTVRTFGRDIYEGKIT